MWLTDLFIKRPTLVTVFLALVLLAGTIAANVLVKQQFPNYDVPTIQISLTYPGGSTTEIRDAIVRPIEDQIAGAPDLQAIETAIQPGQATIVARFALTSDQNSDLVQIQGRVQNAHAPAPERPADADRSRFTIRAKPSSCRLRRNPRRSAPASFPRWLPIKSFPRSNRYPASRSSR